MLKLYTAIITLLLTSEITHAQVFAQFDGQYNPMMEQSIDSKPDPVWSRDFVDRFNLVRVKVFPHNSKYNAPQGKDVVLDKLRIASIGTCNVFKSETPTAEGDVSRNTLINSGKSFDFNTKTLPDPVWIECTQPVEVTRPDFPANPLRYEGLIFLKKVGTSAAPYLTAVNVLPFESYLKGVVPSEMPSSWSFEALKAQAIAARSYGYHELGTNVADEDPNILIEQSGAQIDDTVTYQAYLGLKNSAASTNKAIEETSGKVMTYNGQVIKAYFHADSGGYTENAENVWGVAHPYIIAKEELYPEGSIPGTQWTYTPGLKEVNDKLTSNGFISGTKDVVNLKIGAKDYFPSGRPEFVTLVFADKTEKKILAVDFSFAMRIKSQWVKFSEPNAGTISIFGRGFGHGAGMNQWGARVMVDKLNKTFDEVLKFYYTGIEISQ